MDIVDIINYTTLAFLLLFVIVFPISVVWHIGRAIFLEGSCVCRICIQYPSMPDGGFFREYDSDDEDGE